MLFLSTKKKILVPHACGPLIDNIHSEKIMNQKLLNEFEFFFLIAENIYAILVECFFGQDYVTGVLSVH